MIAEDLLALLSVASLAGFAFVVGARGRFWSPGPFLPPRPAGGARGAGGDSGEWPDVVVVVPARDEAGLLGATLPALMAQGYPGRWRVVLVDDNSTDGTGETAGRLAGSRCSVLAGSPTPPGWTGKVWALSQGVDTAADAEWLWFTDADIWHDNGVLTRLVSLALEEDRALVSVMAELRAVSLWERVVVPAFVYFFAMLYPFRWVSGQGRVAAAAGGCVLVRADALAGSGGLAKMSGAIIDDVALASQIRRGGGRLWLGLDRGVRSLRPYPHLADLWEMVARSAYDELGYSRLRLVGALGGLGLLFGVPLCGLILGLIEVVSTPSTAAAVTLTASAAAVLLQAASYDPTVRLYRLRRGWSFMLPVAGLLYGAMTASSAYAHERGRGASWKGRKLT